MLPKPLRWHERLLIRLLMASPRIDRIEIFQFKRPAGAAAERAALISQLETIYRRSGRQQ